MRTIQAVGEEDGKLGHGLFPGQWRSFPLSGDVSECQVDQFGGGLITGEVAAVIVPPNPQLWLGQDEPRSAQICTLLEQIRDSDRKKYPPPRDAHRKLQPYTVQIPKNIHIAMVSAGLVQLCCDDRFPILVHPENDYDPKLGLLIPDHLARSDAFII